VRGRARAVEHLLHVTVKNGQLGILGRSRMRGQGYGAHGPPQLPLPVPDREHPGHPGEDRLQRPRLDLHSLLGQGAESLTHGRDHRGHPLPVGRELDGIAAAGVDRRAHRRDKDTVGLEPSLHVVGRRHGEARGFEDLRDPFLLASPLPEGRGLLRDIQIADGAVVPAVAADAGEAEKRPVPADDVGDPGQVQGVVLHHDHVAGLQAAQRGQDVLHLITAHRHQHQLERAVRAEMAGHVHPDGAGRGCLDRRSLGRGRVDQGDAIPSQGLAGLVTREYRHVVSRLVQAGRVDLPDHTGSVDEYLHARSRLPVM
jgi:hypothetical protein